MPVAELASVFRYVVGSGGLSPGRIELLARTPPCNDRILGDTPGAGVPELLRLDSGVSLRDVDDEPEDDELEDDRLEVALVDEGRGYLAGLEGVLPGGRGYEKPGGVAWAA